MLWSQVIVLNYFFDHFLISDFSALFLKDFFFGYWISWPTLLISLSFLLFSFLFPSFANVCYFIFQILYWIFSFLLLYFISNNFFLSECSLFISFLNTISPVSFWVYSASWFHCQFPLTRSVLSLCSFSISWFWSSCFKWKVFLKCLMILGHVLIFKNKALKCWRGALCEWAVLVQGQENSHCQCLCIFSPKHVALLWSLAEAKILAASVLGVDVRAIGALGPNTIFSLPLSYTWSPYVWSPETFHFSTCGAANVEPFHQCRQFI